MGRRPKRGNPSLGKREVRRDFTNRCCYYFETVNISQKVEICIDKIVTDLVCFFKMFNMVNG
jgi:hypothetical protein